MPTSIPLRIAIAVGAAVVLLLLGAWISGASVQICQYDQAGDPTNCASYNLALYAILRTGEVINYYSPIATAIAAVAIAFLTLTLRQAQVQTFASAGAQAAAERERYKVLDRAYLAVETHGVSLVPVPESPGKMRTVAGVAIENNGHTPAFLKELYGEFRESSPVGDTPTYADGQTWALNFQVGGRKPQIFLDKEFPFYSSRTTHHYFLGYLTYVDVFGETHTSRFCALIMPHREKWSHAGPSTWNNWD